MRIIPALFIQAGKVVSLYKGNENAEKKFYQKAPHSFVKSFEQQGATRLFVVDLNGREQVRLPELREHFSGELWWAGQVRDLETIDWLLKNGANRVVLGQSARPIFQEALQRYGQEKIIAGLQVKHYDKAPDICENLAVAGFQDIIVKDLNAEGTLFQPNFDLMEKCKYFSGKTIFASGGISKIQHIELLRRAGADGVIIARALYERELNLKDLMHRYESA